MLSPIPDIPALMINTLLGNRILVLADLHIGFELELASQGIRVPSQTKKMLKVIKKLLTKFNPDKIILLGDIKHQIASISSTEWFDVPSFFEELLKDNIKIDIVPGNHDGNLEPLIPRSVFVYSARGIKLRDSKNRVIGLIHGHAWPSPDILEAEILVMGHIHPVIELRDPMGFKIIEPVWVKAQVNLDKLLYQYLKYQRVKVSNDSNPINIFQNAFDVKPNLKEVIIMPAFNPYLRGGSINKMRISTPSSPIIESNSIDLISAEIYALDGTFLGRLELLSQF